MARRIIEIYRDPWNLKQVSEPADMGQRSAVLGS